MSGFDHYNPYRPQYPPGRNLPPRETQNRSTTLWVHPGSFTYRFDPPEKPLETVWTAHPGWGYLKRRDMWIQTECEEAEMMKDGYQPRKPVTDDEVRICPHCGMYICSIPGALVKKHLAVCGGRGEDWLAIENSIISSQRRRLHEQKILAEKMREKAELEALERKERFDEVREASIARQLAKDRKRRLKQETREELKNR